MFGACLKEHIEQRTEALSLSNKTLQYQMLERERIDATLRETQDQLKAEVAALNRLQELSARLLTIPDLPSALAEILASSHGTASGGHGLHPFVQSGPKSAFN